MNVFLKAVACILTTVVMWLTLNKDSKAISLLLILAVSAAVISAATVFLLPIIHFVENLASLSKLDEDLLAVILKVVGIGLLTEVTVLICKDSGNDTTGKALQILSISVVIWLSIPIFERLLSLLDKILIAI